jgi:hypothetical protein
MKYNVGIGATPDLSLRVSVATLVRVLFKNLRDGELMLALERKATLHQAEKGHIVEVKSQPFGGAIRILDLAALRSLIGVFHFDSERSRSEQDFRIFVQPSTWPAVRQICIQNLNQFDDSILETNPTRELTEEFTDALKVNLKPAQYISRPVATVIENDPSPAGNIRAKGIPTVRIFRVFEVDIKDAFLAQTMITNSESNSDRDLCELALVDAQNGGKGRANAVLALPLEQITDIYLAMSLEERNYPILFERHRLDEVVSTVLEGITTTKYQRL